MVTWQMAALGLPLLGGGAALILQAADPQVGAGIAGHSRYLDGPWQRLERTLAVYRSLVYATEEEAAEIGGRLRARHAGIEGAGPDGRPYRALDDQLMAWVHATLAMGVISSLRAFRGDVSAGALDAYWREQLRLAAALGISAGALPGSWPAFEAWFEERAAGLRATPAAQQLWSDLRRLPAPAGVPGPAWALARPFAGAAVRAITAAQLPPALAAGLGFAWTPARRARLMALRAAGHLLLRAAPARLRMSGASRRKWAQSGRPIPRRRRQLPA